MQDDFDPDSLNLLQSPSLSDHRAELISAFHACREYTISLAKPLSAEDQLIQSMPDASPTKWHLAHTTWFFETFILSKAEADFAWFDASFCMLFNSYYNGIGEQFSRPHRGMISRPDLQTVLNYRENVDGRVLAWLNKATDSELRELAALIVLGINHEQQHQELILTDIQHALFQNPTVPAYANNDLPPATESGLEWLTVPEGTYKIGYDGDGFAYDNEMPAHQILLQAYQIASIPVNQKQWLAFIDDGGYRNPLLWLSEGWAWRTETNTEAPLYWRKNNGQWQRFSLSGRNPLDLNAPVTHINYFEADAYARWAGCRLPTEAEWEVAASGYGIRATGRAWEWTASAYLPYPGFNAAPGAVGEYNGKFMINQMVLRGGSIATPSGHCRHSYRNFFPASAQWQFSGLRLAKSTQTM